MNKTDKIRVIIVDDHSIVRRGLGAILSTSDQLELVGEAEDGQEAVELCELVQPDVVLMDLIMPRMDGIDSTRAIHQRWPHINVLVLTSFTEKEMIQGALDAGARGYLLKNVKGRELIDGIIQVYQGGQTIAQEARQTLHLSEQLSMLEGEINDQNVSTALIAESLNKRLPKLFPNYQIQVRLFPDQDLYTYPAQPQNPIPELGWEWLQASGEMKIFSHEDEFPWGGIQTWGSLMLLTAIQGKDLGEPYGGIGLLSVETTTNIDEITEIVTSLARILAMPLERGKIASLDEHRKRASDELEMAGRLQSRILPEKPPAIQGWDLATQLLPARETSGDFYDFIPLANDKWGILIADVTDKGLGAAVFMAMCSALIRTYAVRFPTLPALALSSVNERIFTDMRGGLFLTAFYGILEPHTGRLRYVNAGHNPPFFLRGLKGKPIDKLQRTGIALGVSKNATWQQKVLKFSPGDLLVMYTDGITEAHNRQGTFFSDARLLNTIRANKDRPAGDILEAILGEVNGFIRGALDQDDMALVVLARSD
jgi:serine phosphatase RsbU (regulator of sigma subunit)/DNA-binding NarL/FixJ family response regulator